MFENSNRQFQRGLDAAERRASRRDAALSLRRKQREAHLQKKIRRTNNQPSFYGKQSNSTDSACNAASSLEDGDLPIEHIPRYVAAVLSGDLEKQLMGVTAFRKLFSIECDLPTERIKQCGALPKIIMFMYGETDRCGSSNNQHNSAKAEGRTVRREKEIWSQLQFEAAWVITNVAASTSELTHYVCIHGAIEAFIYLFSNAQNQEIADQAVWGLGNIAGDGRHLLDRILMTNNFQPFLKDLTNNLPSFGSNLQQNAVWLISNLCRWQSLQLDHIRLIVPVLCEFLCEPKDNDIVRYSLWTFSYLATDPSDDVLDYLVEQTDVISVCIRLLHQEMAKYQVPFVQLEPQNKHQHNTLCINPQTQKQEVLKRPSITQTAMLKMNHLICRPCLRFIGSLCAEKDEVTQAVINAGFLDVIEPFANHFMPNLRKETLWALSNILAGTPQQIEALLSRQDLLMAIIDAGISGKQQVQREAFHCIVNAVADASTVQKKTLIDAGALKVFAKTLETKNLLNGAWICAIVEALEELLGLYGTNCVINPVADQIEELHILDYLEERQSADSLHEDTFNCILNMMQKYWPDDGFDPLETMDKLADTLSASANEESNTFSFGCPVLLI